MTGVNEGLTFGDAVEVSRTDEPGPDVVKVSQTAPIGGNVIAVPADPKDAQIAELMAMIKKQQAEIEAARAAKDAAEEAREGTATVSKASSRERWAIIIEEGQNENDMPEVHVGVNGRAYQIKRGQIVEVPREVISVLKDAVVAKTIATTVEIGGLQFNTGHTVRHSRRFPFRVLGKVLDAEGKRLTKYETDTATDDLGL